VYAYTATLKGIFIPMGTRKPMLIAVHGTQLMSHNITLQQLESFLWETTRNMNASEFRDLTGF
jgi:hypothetical protein